VLRQISVTILTKNSERYLPRCLDALQEFKEVLIVDNGSTDRTLQIARNYPNVRIIEHEFIGFGPLKNFAAQQAEKDWIFSVDSDEVASPELIASIKKLDPEDSKKIYSIERLNHYRGKPITCCGWSPDRVTRIFNRKFTSFSNALVHETILRPPGSREVLLKGKLLHYPFDSVESLVNKMQNYSTLYAEQSHKTSSPAKAFWRATFSFFKNYFLQKGFLEGYEGLLISISNANGVFYKYMKLYEKQKEHK
jgi:glycosyltransferase involved in cell wall biosynthesis